MSDIANKLSEEESAVLAKLELTIQIGEKHFIAVGQAVSEIRDRKLWREKFSTFEEYCQIKWNWTGARLRQLIDASEVVEELPPKVQQIVANEGVARELARVPRKSRPSVLVAAQRAQPNGKPVTARSVAEAAARVVPPPASAPQGPIDVQEIVRDATGFVVPEQRVAFWKRREEVRELLTRISSVRGRLRAVNDQNDPLYAFVNKPSTMSLLDNAFGELRMALPYVVCPYCQGQRIENCTSCRKTGFLPEHIWKTAVPQQLKDVRASALQKK